MSLRTASIAFDCVDAAGLAAFWAALLNSRRDPGATPFYATVGLTSEPPLVPVYLFIRVPERRTDKNRLHVDLVAPDPQEQVARALSLGARRVQDFNEYGHQWTTLADPEGNLFDIGGTS